MGDIKCNLKELLQAGGYEEDTNIPYSANLVDISKEVQRRVRALKKYQVESIEMESKFYQRVHDLEKEFQPFFNAINQKRRAVVMGEHEPADEECNLPLIHDLPADDLQKLENDAPVEGTPSKGVPNFWLHVLNNSSQIGDMIHEYDAPILKFITDITAEVHTGPAGFSLLFHFAENPFFSNSILTKYYELKIAPEQDEPFDFDGPTVIKSKGTVIDWKSGKNVTQKVVKKKQKKGDGAERFITKTVPSASFFKFFDASLKELTDDLDPESEHAVHVDFEMGQIIREQIVPRAVLFFTGEGVEDDFDGFDDENGDDSDDASDGDDEED